MNKLLTIIFALILLASLATAQWTYQGSFPSDAWANGTGAHGIAVDPAGKVWFQFFGNSDTIFNGTSYVPCRAVYVFNPDGSQASFSPIRTVTVGGLTDTLYNSNRGLRADETGNILVSSFDVLYRINYQTGVGMNRIQPQPGQTLDAVAVDNLGEIFVGKVIPGNPLQILDNAFNILGNVTDTTIGFSRTLEVSGDGNDVYWCGFTEHAIYRYHSDFGSFGPYVLQDSVFKGFDCESIGWNPTRTRLWASAGSANDRPNRFPGETTNYDLNTWYAWDPSTGAIDDSIKWDFTFSTDSVNVRPRAIAFSPDGNTAYVGCFGLSTYPAMQKFSRVTSVEPIEGVLPTSFSLDQNFPNPFNPSTEIHFTLIEGGRTTLRVFDMLGREIATLLDEDLDAGAYRKVFDASRLSSGTYMYSLTSNGSTITKKMLLMK